MRIDIYARISTLKSQLKQAHVVGTQKNSLIEAVILSTQNIYSRLSLTQLCITQYYRLSRLDGPVPVFSPYILLQFHNVYLDNG